MVWASLGCRATTASGLFPTVTFAPVASAVACGKSQLAVAVSACATLPLVAATTGAASVSERTKTSEKRVTRIDLDPTV
jgi:hypothetical protein